jgi:TrmH family RNA methyltransferase
MAQIPLINITTADFSEGLHLLIDTVQDPGNLGTIIRIADWYGIKTIITSPNSVDVYNPKTISATMGSLLRVNILAMEYQEVVDLGYPLYISSLDGELNVHQLSINKGLIIIGNEAHGVSENFFAYPHKTIKIPQFGGAESLNAAVATGIICDNIFRQNVQ